MQSRITVVEKAKTLQLVSLYEFKLALNITSTDTAVDNGLELMIDRSSDEIATYCNRVFGQETVIESFVDGSDPTILLLSRYPVKEIGAIIEDGEVLSAEGYGIDNESGNLTRIGSTWSTPISVAYTGGYVLPKDAPPALKQAVLMMARDAYYTSLRGDSSVRMISHKESRIMYYPQGGGGGASGMSSGGGGGQSATRRAVNDMLVRFTRYAM